MTDKQIIENKNGFYCIEPCSEIKQLKEQLKAKEQECEELKEILNEGCLHNLTLMTEQRVLLQTLAEIKKLVEKAREDLYTCESIGYADDDLRSILQKINEVTDK